jgi:hypothetical protein
MMVTFARHYAADSPSRTQKTREHSSSMNSAYAKAMRG